MVSCSSATAGAASSLTAVVFQSWMTIGRSVSAIVRAVRVSCSATSTSPPA